MSRVRICRELKRPPAGVVVWREGVPAQVSSSSLDHGSRLRGLSPKALVLLNSAMLILYHSARHAFMCTS
ncbi:hypothetical protein TNCV_4974941 [Trichonephila clavipes]|uniref:Uncharacterized protein n=1 Tax=Trichonephila clavipes TaxID=2585209 RepID=A0A8X6VLL7_TRICX|nr:hypothetical protein TNCV_4974941 [Trichonephila clavipes]